MPRQEPSGEVPDISVSSSQGVFAGSGNQYNNWAQKQPLDPAALGALNPHIAVTRLQQLTHDDLVDFFSRASPDDVGEILDVFFIADLTKLVTALGDINRRKATELIRALGEDHDLALLDDLPEAAYEIAREAARLRWTDAGTLEAFNVGYARKYKNGHVFWSKRFGMRTTAGAIDDCMADDDEGIPWGFPAGDQRTAEQSLFGTGGFRQSFETGTVYSSKHGIFLVTDEVFYRSEGGSSGWLGFPVSGRERNGQLGDRQRFEGGAIYSFVVQEPEMLRSFAVRREVMSVLPDRGWRPISTEASAVSSSGERGTVQHVEFFQTLEALNIRDGTSAIKHIRYKTAVYASEGHGPVLVTHGVWNYYTKLGAEKSWLGFPIDPPRVTLPGDLGFQNFEAGRVYWQRGIGPFAVSDQILRAISRIAKSEGFGFPESEEQPVGGDGSGRIQYFARGVVTMRDGKYEAWLRTEPMLDGEPEPYRGPSGDRAEPYRELLVEPTTATPKGAVALPVANYDELTVASLRARLRNLPVDELNQLIEYEKSHAARADVISMLERRIDRMTSLTPSEEFVNVSFTRFIDRWRIEDGRGFADLDSARRRGERGDAGRFER